LDFIDEEDMGDGFNEQNLVTNGSFTGKPSSLLQQHLSTSNFIQASSSIGNTIMMNLGWNTVRK
jgi:hypothetical protein